MNSVIFDTEVSRVSTSTIIVIPCSTAIVSYVNGKVSPTKTNKNKKIVRLN